MANIFENQMEETAKDSLVNVVKASVDEAAENSADEAGTIEKAREAFLSEFCPVESSASGRADGCSISVVNTQENGKRVRLSKKAMQILGSPNTVQVDVSKTGTCVAVATELPKSMGSFKVSKGNIYSGSLVEELTKKLNLDFSDGRTSILLAQDREIQIIPGIKTLVFRVN